MVDIYVYAYICMWRAHLPVERVDGDADLTGVCVDMVALEPVAQVGEKGWLVQVVEARHVLDAVASERIREQQLLRAYWSEREVRGRQTRRCHVSACIRAEGAAALTSADWVRVSLLSSVSRVTVPSASREITRASTHSSPSASEAT